MSISRRVRNKKQSTASEAKETADDLNRIWCHIIKICMPGNQRKTKNLLMIFNMYCFMQDYNYAIWRDITYLTLVVI